ncbi:MAG: hypothetical protein IPQ03_04260 [Bacteroidetes bacterium]|nr:hypothetical protein [Bacteroidota bacterium]
MLRSPARAGSLRPGLYCRVMRILLPRWDKSLTKACAPADLDRFEAKDPLGHFFNQSLCTCGLVKNLKINLDLLKVPFYFNLDLEQIFYF